MRPFVKQFHVPVYDRWVLLAAGRIDGLTKVRDTSFPHLVFPAWGEDCGAQFIDGENGKFALLFTHSSIYTSSIVAHECAHCAGGILRYAGVVEPLGGEAFAYLLGFLVDKVESLRQKFNSRSPRASTKPSGETK